MQFSSKDLYVWRITAAVSWSVLLQLIFQCVYIILINLYSTLDLFGAAYQYFFSTKCFNIFPLGIVIIILGVLSCKKYIRPPDNCKNSRFHLILNFFTFHNLMSLSFHILLGYLINHIYSSLSRENIATISVKCSGSESTSYSGCLNERKFFLILGGTWTGFYTFTTNYFNQSTALVFHVVQQYKFVRFKAAFFPCLKKSLTKAVFPSLLFCVIYYLKGWIVRMWFCSFTDLNLPKDLIDTVFILFNFEVLYYMWLFTAIYILTVDMMTLLLNIHLTERAYFPISSFSLMSSDLTGIWFIPLQDTLSTDKVPIIQHLGFFDLASLSQFDSQRRAELFTLSQPGGHPHSWNAILNESLKVIDRFTAELDKCTSINKLSETGEGNVKPKSDTAEFHHSCHNHSYRMRNLSTTINRDCDCSPTQTLYQSYERLMQVYYEWLNKKLDAFYKKPIIAYFFSEKNEQKVKTLLFQGQPVIWAVESLSFLACHSLKEDSFGIAQKDLPAVISSLLQLKNSLDKLQKQSIFIKRAYKIESVDVQLKNCLKFSVKQSIYRIAIAFKEYLKDINLEPIEIQAQMLNFIEFKEV